MSGDLDAEHQIERTPDAKRLQIKSWTCKDCGSRHSRKHDAKRQLASEARGERSRARRQEEVEPRHH